MYEWDFSPVFMNADMLLRGLLNTLKVTGSALAFGIPLGLALALLRLSPRRLLAWPAGFVIEFFRTTPPLVQLFWFFFALPILIQVEMTPYMAATLTFSIQSSAFFAEVFRGGIVSIERGQWEGARAIGMSDAQAMRRIILPQAVKRMIPAFMERAIELMKTTDGAYLFANPQGTVGPRLWGLPVVTTTSMTVDTALTGSFRLGAQIFDREDANVVVSTEDQDNFVKNMVTIRSESRVALAVYRPEAFIRNTNLPAFA